MNLVKTTAVIAATVRTFILGAPVANASGYFGNVSYKTYTPRSWRGIYRSANGSIMKVNTYSMSFNGETLYKSS